MTAFAILVLALLVVASGAATVWLLLNDHPLAAFGFGVLAYGLADALVDVCKTAIGS